MKITASVLSSSGSHQVEVNTSGTSKSIAIPSKSSGIGSSVNGGEVLFLALATCYCNDVFREAAREELEIVEVEVTVQGEFGGVGEPAKNVTYSCQAKARNTTVEKAENLLRHTDTVAEIQNTLRQGMPVVLDGIFVRIVD